MRCCMYCGKELNKDERCDCPQSRAYRASAEKRADGAEKASSGTRGKNKAQKVKFKRSHRVNERKKGIFGEFKSFIASFFRDPVYVVSNPGAFDKVQSIITVALEGIVFSLIIFFSYSGMKRSIFGVVLNAVGFGGVEGLKTAGMLAACILSVTLINFALYFIITGIFYLESRYLYRSNAGFWDIASRFAISTVPVTAVGLIGIVLNFISMTTVIAVLMAGMISSFILNYEGLSSVWNFSPSRTMYIMSSGYLFYFGIAYHLLTMGI
ncbi:MAG: YIP1 family protein [Oscillospiraceae bacterium]|nr:YIP1 family protein [Oscillospiraceae bacterium]